MPKIIGENIDRLCNIEYRPAVGSQRGDIMRYYNAAREVQKDPLSYLCAKALMDRVKEGDTVLFVTGARFPHLLPYGETDGPLGVAALAKAVERGLGPRPSSPWRRATTCRPAAASWAWAATCATLTSGR